MAVNLPPINDDSSRSDNNVDINQNFQKITNNFKTNVIKDETGTNATIVGKTPEGFGQSYYDSNGTPFMFVGRTTDGSFKGFKVAQEGQDITTATDDQLIMSSEFNMFKIVQTGTATVSLANPVTHYSTTTSTVNHNLGYKPAAFVYCEADASLGSELFQVPRTAFDATGAFGFSANFTITTTQIQFHIQPGAATAYDNTDWTFKYYLVRETSQ